MDAYEERATMTQDSASSPRLKGILRMIANHMGEEVDPCEIYEHDLEVLAKTTISLKNRRQRQRQPNSNSWSPRQSSFADVIARHKFVAFLMVQGNPAHYYSKHTLSLRERLGRDYYDVITTFVIPLGLDDGSTSSSTTPQDPLLIPTTTGLFADGTGFAALPASALTKTGSLLLTLLNVDQVPSVVVLDATTGQRLSKDASLAIEWNDPHSVINAWQTGESGLTTSQKALAVASMQSDCTIQ